MSSEAVTRLTGITGIAFALGVPAALLLSLGLTSVYRRAVRREMALRAGSARVRPGEPGLVAAPAWRSGSSVEVGADWRRRRRRAAFVVVVAGLVYAVSMGLLMLMADGTPVLPLRLWLVTACFFTPFAVGLAVFYVPSWRARLGGFVAYALAVGICTVASVPWYGPYVAWTLWAGPPTLLILGFLWQRVRAVGELSLAFVLLVIVAANLALGLLSEHVRGAVDVGAAFGLGAYAIFGWVLAMGGFAGAVAGWVVLRLLGKLYASRRINDQTLIIDSTVVSFATFNAADVVLATQSTRSFALGFAPLVLSVVVAAVMRRALRSRRAAPPLRLLFLRVFSEGSAGPALWRALAGSWRYVGSIHFIGGPDLATSAVEPHRFLDFLSGAIGRRFITDEATLSETLAAVDERPDVEGRYPVSELYCRDDTWQLAFARLCGRCDVILMDLRGFTAQRAGARYELATLAAHRVLERSVVIVDASTDVPLLRYTADAAAGAQYPLRLLSLAGRSVDDRRLMSELLAAAHAR